MSRKKGKKMTLEVLSTQMKRGFAASDAKIEKLAVLTRKNTDLTERFATATAEDFATIDKRFEKVEGRLVDLDEHMRNGFEEIMRKLDDIDTRIAGLELKVYGFSRERRALKSL